MVATVTRPAMGLLRISSRCVSVSVSSTKRFVWMSTYTHGITHHPWDHSLRLVVGSGFLVKSCLVFQFEQGSSVFMAGPLLFGRVLPLFIEIAYVHSSKHVSNTYNL